MPACRMCKQFYPESQFISGNGPRYQVCARCGVESGLATREETPQLYSDELVNARSSIHSNLNKLDWNKGFYRKDIAFRVIDK